MLPIHSIGINDTSTHSHSQYKNNSSNDRLGSAGYELQTMGTDDGLVSPRHARGVSLGGGKGRGIASLTVDTTPFAARRAATAAKDGVSLSTARTNGPQQQGSKAAREARPKPPRWRSWEFRFYYLVFIVVVPYMVWVPMQLSNPETNPNFYRFSQHLRQGWMFGRLRDDSDFQYKSFRDQFPLLAGLVLIYVLLSKGATALGSIGQGSSASYRPVGSSASGCPRPFRRTFLTLFTAVFILALHGTNTPKLLLALGANYSLGRPVAGRGKLAPLVIWAFNVNLLFAVHYYDGWPWRYMSDNLAWLDNYTGLLPRWQINFNISMLRLISFSMDLHWAKTALARGEPGRVALEENDPAIARKQTATPLPLADYSMLHYLLYVMFPPLFIAGPIMTFNDWTRQLYQPPPMPTRATVSYALRFLSTLLTMEFILHFMYVNAIKDAKAWTGASPMQLSMIGFWNLIVVWLKLLIPWRFFRLWALLDGVDPPENMVRCMANNYSTLGFWRSWHRSYNLWIVRYIYVPVGGSKALIPSTLLVFTFVALWHDLSLKLLAWGWLVTLFILPEILARALLPASRHGGKAWYRHVCAAGGVFNVLLMMTANLVGFVVGVDGIRYMWQQLLADSNGLIFLATACSVLFVGVQVMLEYREEELRHGISRKC